jgi:hypothetical protein
VIAVLLGIVLVKKYLLTNDRPQSAPRMVAGTRMALPGVDWSKNGQTLMLVLQKGCHFCTESAPFYQRLVKEAAERGNVHFVAVLPQEVPEEKKYLEEIKVPIDEVKQASRKIASQRRVQGFKSSARQDCRQPAVLRRTRAQARRASEQAGQASWSSCALTKSRLSQALSILVHKSRQARQPWWPRACPLSGQCPHPINR